MYIVNLVNYKIFSSLQVKSSVIAESKIITYCRNTHLRV
jgi:hypothetical protein